MDEAWVVSRAHGELGAQSGVDAIFNVVLRSDVSDFNISGVEHVLASVQVNHLHHGHLLDVADVAHGF